MLPSSEDQEDLALVQTMDALEVVLREQRLGPALRRLPGQLAVAGGFATAALGSAAVVYPLAVGAVPVVGVGALAVVMGAWALALSGGETQIVALVDDLFRTATGEAARYALLLLAGLFFGAGLAEASLGAMVTGALGAAAVWFAALPAALGGARALLSTRVVVVAREVAVERRLLGRVIRTDRCALTALQPTMETSAAGTVLALSGHARVLSAGNAYDAVLWVANELSDLARDARLQEKGARAPDALAALVPGAGTRPAHLDLPDPERRETALSMAVAALLVVAATLGAGAGLIPVACAVGATAATLGLVLWPFRPRDDD